MKIGVVGTGFTGLSTAYYLLTTLPNAEVTLFEAENQVGGLAGGFKEKKWEWYVDYLIHHFFSTDKHAFDLAKAVGLGEKIMLKDTKSSTYYGGRIAELDSPISLLKFPFMGILDRIRTGIVMGWLRLHKNYLWYEHETAYHFLKKYMGKNSFEILWKPLFEGKFGSYAPSINATWFWARINPRTKKLGYIEGGVQLFAERVADKIRKGGGKILLNEQVFSVAKDKEGIVVKTKKKNYRFDKVVVATSTEIFLNIACGLPKDYIEQMARLKTIGSQYFVFELDRPFLKDGTYWLNVNDSKFPFMMVAEHTNFVDKKHYNNSHIIWVGKYLDENNPLWNETEQEFFTKVVDYLKKIDPTFNEKQIKNRWFKRFRYSQPIIKLNYSKLKPEIKTPLEGLYVANMHQIYPWDRGVNHAVELGKRVVDELLRGE